MKRNIFILLIVASILMVFSTLVFAFGTSDVKDYIKGKFPVIYNIYLAPLGKLDEYEKEFIDLLQNLPEEEQKNFAKEVYNNGFSKEILEKIKKEDIITKPETLLGSPDISFAQSDEIDLTGDYWKGYVSDTKALITSPLHWDSSDWMKAFVFVSITGVLYVFDENIQDWVQKNRSSTSDEISSFAKPFGEAYILFPSLGILYLYGHLSEDKKAKKTALLSMESFVVTGLFTQALKFIGHRHRPSSGDSSNIWDGPGFSTSHLSFPSGHASSAFAIATVIACEYEDKFLIPALSYGIATLTALSMVNDNAHWASDVFFGAGIGYFIGKAIVNLHRGKDNKFTILPVITEKCRGILVEYNF